MIGDTNSGKTQWILDGFNNPYIHTPTVNWAAYEATEHDVIIYDDLVDPIKYYNANKILTQSQPLNSNTHSSNTNCYSVAVNTWKKPQAFLMNLMGVCTQKERDYVQANSFMVHIPPGEKLWDENGITKGEAQELAQAALVISDTEDEVVDITEEAPHQVPQPQRALSTALGTQGEQAVANDSQEYPQTPDPCPLILDKYKHILEESSDEDIGLYDWRSEDQIPTETQESQSPKGKRKKLSKVIVTGKLL